MKVNKKMITFDNVSYYEDGFLNMLEDHYTYLKDHPDTKQYPVKPEEHSVYRGDLYGLLNHIRTPAKLHWITMRLTGMVNPNQFNNSYPLIYIPNSKVIDRLNQLYNTSVGTVGM